MGFSKSYGPVTISQDAGVASITVNAAADLGGGAVKGVVSAKVAASVQVKELVLADAGLGILAGAVPSLKVEIDALQAFVDAELAKL